MHKQDVLFLLVNKKKSWCHRYFLRLNIVSYIFFKTVQNMTEMGRYMDVTIHPARKVNK